MKSPNWTANGGSGRRAAPSPRACFSLPTGLGSDAPPAPPRSDPERSGTGRRRRNEAEGQAKKKGAVRGHPAMGDSTSAPRAARTEPLPTPGQQRRPRAPSPTPPPRPRAQPRLAASRRGVGAATRTSRMSPTAAQPCSGLVCTGTAVSTRAPGAPRGTQRMQRPLLRAPERHRARRPQSVWPGYCC